MNLEGLQNIHDEYPRVNPFYISFSDLMVLLSVFFLMILSASRVETGSFERLKTGFSGKSEGTLVELAEQLKKAAAGIPNISIRMAPDGVSVDLPSAALFDSASAALRTDALTPVWPVLDEIKRTTYQIDIEGHSDDRALYNQRGDELETNWSLSGRRASSVVHALIERGFSESRLRIVGYAANHPRVEVKGKKGGRLERARSANRRVSILVH